MTCAEMTTTKTCYFWYLWYIVDMCIYIEGKG